MHCRDQQRYVTDRAVRGFSLLEVVIVTSLLAFLAWLVVPNITAQVNVQKLPRSAEQLRGLLRFTRAQAQLDGLRYRVRFRMPDELANPEVFDRWYPFQPVVEIEREPLLEPGVFKIVTNSWAMTPVLYEPVRCARVRLGEYDPLADDEYDDEAQRKLRDMDEEELLAPVVFEPDGSAERATFVLTATDDEVTVEELLLIQEDDLRAVLEVNLEGRTGQVWLHRPFIEEEKELFRERRIRPDLRMDFTSTDVLTEDNILELQLSSFRSRAEDG